jgi:uncharacterized protein
MVKKNNGKENRDIEIRFLEDCLLIDNEILIFGDLHLGYEEYISDRGIFPRVQFKGIIEKLDKIFILLKKERIKLKKVIILGDIKHEFGKISDLEWSDTKKLLDYLEKYAKIIIVKGNHDNILKPIIKKRKIIFKDYYKTKKTCFLHGNKLWKNCLESADFIIMGHLHPTITLEDKYKKERYRCFLKGRWKNKRVIILPSFSPISSGYDLRRLKHSSSKKDKEGFLLISNNKLKDFEVVIYNKDEDKFYDFGKLKKFL